MKILGSDFDGTLTHGGITERKLLAIREWRKNGHKFGIVSGRGKGFHTELLQQIPDLELDFFVMCNGAYITSEDGSVVYEARCNEVSLLELAKDLFSWGCRYACVSGKQFMCVVERDSDCPSCFSEDRVLLDRLPAVDYFNQVSTLLPSVEEAKAVVEKIRGKYAGWLNPLQNGACIDIVPAGINKAQGMYRVMETFGAAYGDVITVGDHINDADMIREFRSYAMRGGVEEIKSLADGIVSDVTEILENEL